MKTIFRYPYSRLPYFASSGGKYRDLRGFELRVGNRERYYGQRFVRVSMNGQYRDRSGLRLTRYPGHVWHLSFNLQRRGVTLTYGIIAAMLVRRLPQWLDWFGKAPEFRYGSRSHRFIRYLKGQ